MVGEDERDSSSSSRLRLRLLMASDPCATGLAAREEDREDVGVPALEGAGVPDSEGAGVASSAGTMYCWRFEATKP